MTKKQILIGVTGIAIAIVSFSAIHTVRAISQLETDVKPLNYATTTPSYLVSGGATATTSPIDLRGIDLVDINIQLTGSSSEAVLNWKYEFSDDNIDWFGEDLAQTNSATSISHSSTTLNHTWKPSVATQVRKNISIEPIGSRYMRVIFSTTGANSAVWARFALKEEKND